MSTTNGDREVYLAFLRKTEERKRPRPAQFPSKWERLDAMDEPISDISRLLLIVAAIVLATLCAYGIWQSITEPTWAQKVFVECRAQGKVPHVERAADGHMLAVRCDKQ